MGNVPVLDHAGNQRTKARAVCTPGKHVIKCATAPGSLSFFLFFFSFYVGICFGYVQVSVGAEGGQKRLSDPQDQEL